jgi:hypothetical protein
MKDALDITFKIIYIMRDPVQAVTSFYKHAFTAEKKWALDHSAAILKCGILSVHPIAIYSYAKQIDLFMTCVDRDSILLVGFDDFVRDPQGTVARVARFLNIDDDFVYRDSHKQHSAAERLAKDKGSLFLDYDLPSWKLDDVARLAINHLLIDDLHRLRDQYGFDCSNWLSV